MNNLPAPTTPTASAKKRIWILWVSLILALPPIVLAVGSPYLYVLDLAMVAFWWVWCPVVLALFILFVCTRSRVVVASLIVTLCFSWPVVASRTLWTPREPGDHEITDVSIAIFNSNMNNPTRGEVGPFVFGLDTDVIVVIEPVWEFYRSIQMLNQTHPAYPNILERFTEEMSPHFLVFSKWKLSQIENEPLANADGLVCVVHRPDDLGGPFLVVAAYPPSPRNSTRWVYGNHSMRRTANRIKSLIDSGHHVVFAADLNSAPGCKRDRTLRISSEIQRGKPLLGTWGTFPASWAVGRIAIDDIWVSRDIVVKSWKTIPGPGSDHLAVQSTLRIPRSKKP